MILASASLRDEVTVLCLTFVELRYLPYSVFEELVLDHPMEKKRLRKATVRMAVCRGIVAYARKVLSANADVNHFFMLAGGHSLIDSPVKDANGAASPLNKS